MIIVWFRHDLRLRNNKALYFAAKEGAEIIPVYIFDRASLSSGRASLWWLHHSLEALQDEFKKRNMSFFILEGETIKTLMDLVKKYKATAVFWNRCYEPNMLANDQKIISILSSQRVKTNIFNGQLLHDPRSIKNNQGEYYKVFSAFWKHCKDDPLMQSTILPIPRLLKGLPYRPSKQLQRLNLLPKDPDWSIGFSKRFNPGEENALKKLNQFIKTSLLDYAKGRDYPMLPCTSLLSAHLHFGEITPLQILNSIKKEERLRTSKPETIKKLKTSCDSFLRELGFREFSYYLLYHFPNLSKDNFSKKFDKFPWKKNKKAFKKWQQGRTGYPIVDAGMRELWLTGYMHNRVRMIVASFLIKDLLLHWKEGAKWFLDTLLDADLAVNATNWQWVAGTGPNAAPFFRIFNPITQSKKFDADGQYIRRYVPELAALPNKYLHEPWCAPQAVLKDARIILGKNYPYPIIEHHKARGKALKYYNTLRS